MFCCNIQVLALLGRVMETSLLYVSSGKHCIQVLQKWEIPSHIWDLGSHSNQLSNNHCSPFCFWRYNSFRPANMLFGMSALYFFRVKFTTNYPTFVVFCLISDSLWQVHAFSHCENVISKQPSINLLDGSFGFRCFQTVLFFLKRQNTSVLSENFP